MNQLFAIRDYTGVIHIANTMDYVDEKAATMWFKAAYEMDDLEECRKAARCFEYTTLDEEAVDLLWLLPAMCRKHGFTIVGSTDPHYEPTDKECVIYYGPYPVTWKQFCADNKSYCNANFYDCVVHDKFVSAQCWDNIDQIFILNLKKRTDRRSHILCELSKVCAPLDKLCFVYGVESSDRYIAATEDHFRAMSIMMVRGYQTCLFLEDDVVFARQPQFTEFFQRSYKFDIVFLATSRWWRREPLDDLLIRTYQSCTTSSSYMLAKETLPVVMACVKEGIEIMKAGGSTNEGAIDCHWRNLQPRNQMFVFKDKPCFQLPGWSNIVGRVTAHYD